jgi:DNA-binding beta-propeller fold protein YncE
MPFSVGKGRVYDWSHAVGQDEAKGTSFNHIQTMFLGKDGVIYTTNRGSENNFGVHVNKLQLRGPGEEEHIADFFEYGEGAGHSTSPMGVAVDNHDLVYVTDEWTNTISVFDSNGKFLRTWGRTGSDDGELLRPAGLVVERSGNIIVVDSGNNRLQVFTPDGEFVGKCGKAGSRDGEFNQPWGITLDKDGNIYVADRRNHRVQKLSPEGKFLMRIGEYGEVEEPKDAYAVTMFGPYVSSSSETAGYPKPGLLNHPTDVAVDPDGDIYITDSGNHRVCVFDSEARPITNLIGNAHVLSKWGQQSIDANPDMMRAPRGLKSLEPQWGLYFPTAVAFDPETDSIVVAESQRDRLQIYKKVRDYSDFQSSIGNAAPDATFVAKDFLTEHGSAPAEIAAELRSNMENAPEDPAPRHLVGKFADQVRKEAVEELTVRVSHTDVPGRSAKLDLQIPPEGVYLDISVIAETFEFEGQQTASLFVPPTGDSALVGFRLKALKDGPTQIYISAFHGGTKVADLTLRVTVGTTANETPPGQPASSVIGNLLNKPRDVVSLQLIYHKPSDTYLFVWHDEEGWQPAAYTKKQFAELDKVIKKTKNEIEEIARLDYNTKSEAAKHKLRTRGIGLWEDLVPCKIRDRFYSRHDKIRRIIIYANEDLFPWEMLYPYRKEPHFDCDQFLIELVEVCRWVHGSEPPTTIPVRRADFVVAVQAELDKADAEITKVIDLLKIWNAALQGKRIEDANELFQLFKQKIVSLLHFACHQSFDQDIERIMVNNDPVTPQDFVDAQLLADAAPFIFMNACRSDRKVPGYTKMGGWANSFLSAGAGAFIGTLWEVRDETAKLFAETLYQELFHLEQQQTFGEALRRARLAVQKEAPGDPTWLAYSFYGNSDARVTKI